MPLTVNGDPHPFRDGLTVAQLLDEKRYTYPLKTVFINGERVSRDAYEQTALADGDTVDVIHLMSGG